MSIYEMLENASYREALIDSICDVSVASSDFRDIIEYVLDYKFDMFKEYDKPLYEGDDYTTSLILPSIRRVWANTFIEPPTLLKDKKLELYKLLFNIDEFLLYTKVMLNSDFSIEPFEHIDRSCEVLKMIVDNYIAMNFKIAYNIPNDEVDSKIIELKRNKKINNLIR